MIFVGTDIVPIIRIENLIKEKGKRFLNHIYTELEQNVCNAKKSPFIHYSGKFAAKEAVKKALLSSKLTKDIPLVSIEIQNDDDGTPFVHIPQESIKYEQLQISISHAGEYATATAILKL